MSKKLYAVLLPVVAVAAFAVVPAMASASTAYGTCATGTHSANCPAGQAFTEFTEKREGVNGKKVSTEFVLETEVGAQGIKCTVIDFVGKMWNVGGVGHSHMILVFENCKAFGAELETVCNATNPINGNGIIEGVVTDEVSAAEKVKITIESGFGVKCGTTNLGNVTGSATGSQANASPILKFSKATGLTFDSKPSTISGEVEFVTIEGSKKIYI
jgi:hypothetical protein